MRLGVLSFACVGACSAGAHLAAPIDASPLDRGFSDTSDAAPIDATTPPTDASIDDASIHYVTYTLPFTDTADGLDDSLHLRISAGGGPSHLVQLDTGSTGIVLPRSAIGAGVTAYSPTRPFSITYTSSGRVFTGETMQAVVVIGLDGEGNPAGKPTTLTMDIGVADMASCASGYPDCTVPTSIDGIGLMGVGFARGASPTVNPFLMLRGMGSPELWPGYVLTANTVTLGLSPELLQGFVSQILTPASTATYDWGPPAGCVDVTTTPLFAPSCGELLVDTGIAESIVQTSPMPTAVIDASTNRLVAGVPFAVTIPSATMPALTFAFSTGAAGDGAAAYVQWSDHLHDGHTFINTGRHLLQHADVAYDALNGRYGVRPR